LAESGGCGEVSLTQIREVSSLSRDVARDMIDRPVINPEGIGAVGGAGGGLLDGVAAGN
jgi:hypothetical protein